jgi:hypothetical protein
MLTSRSTLRKLYAESKSRAVIDACWIDFKAFRE